MKYVSWAAFYEGSSDALYLSVLLPRVMRNLVANEGVSPVEIPDLPAVTLGSKGRSVDAVAEEVCASREAFDIVFVHADTGGRHLENSMEPRANAYCTRFSELCDWPIQRCVMIMPRHEIEAWLLADGHAVTAALGFRGDHAEIGLPDNAQAAERLSDPKQVLNAAITQIVGRRRVRRIDNIWPAIANGQQIELLRGSTSFSDFEERLRACLRQGGYLN